MNAQSLCYEVFNIGTLKCRAQLNKQSFYRSLGGLMLTNCSNMTHEHEKDRESWGFGFCWRRLDWGEIQVCSYRPIKQICHSNWNSQQKANKSLSQWITLESFSRTSKPHTTSFRTRLHRFYWCRCISLENAQCASLKNV